MAALDSDPAVPQSLTLRFLLLGQLRELGFLSSTTTVDDVQSLFDAGVLDSLRLMELVSRLESRFRIEVSADDLVPENFDSIAGMVGYIRGRLDRPTV